MNFTALNPNAVRYVYLTNNKLDISNLIAIFNSLTFQYDVFICLCALVNYSVLRYYKNTK